MTKDAAELVMATKNALETTWFCPLIKDMCNKKCLCYVASYVREYKENQQEIEYKATEPCCRNQMFF